jgi:DNA repair protein RadC
MIGYEKLFHGTLSWTPVIPREVARHVLIKNAAAVILHHNHPSGCCRPSASDIELTTQLRQTLNLIDVEVIDHIITSDESAFSMAGDVEVWSPGHTAANRIRVKQVGDGLPID